MVVSATFCTSNLPYGYCGVCGHELEAVHYCVEGWTLCKNCYELGQYNNIVVKKGEWTND